MKLTLKMVLLLLYCLMMAACIVPNSTIRQEFEKSTKAYNKMLRWREVENAGMIYLEPERRDEFMKAAEGFKKREVTITDFRILTFECVPDKGTGEVMAEFDYYVLPSNRIKTQSYHQEWVYRDTNKHKSWKLKSGLPPFE